MVRGRPPNKPNEAKAAEESAVGLYPIMAPGLLIFD